MFHLIVSLMVFAGALAANAQESTSSYSIAPWDSSVGVTRGIDPVVQIGSFLQDQPSRRAEAPTGLMTPGLHGPLAEPGIFTMHNALEPTRSFTVEPRLPGEYDVRNNFNPLESYTIRVQPWDGFTIQNNLRPMQSYVVHEQPWGGWNVQNRINPMESYTIPQRPSENFGTHSFQPFDGSPMWSPASEPWQQNSFPGPAGYQPFTGPSFPMDFPPPFGLP